MELNQKESFDNSNDEQDGEYYDYRSRTRLGSRYDTIIALYGTVNIWTLYCYWHRDSILKQSIMLLDKSGLRKKGKSSKYKIGDGTGNVIKASSQEDINAALNRFKTAYQKEEGTVTQNK